MKRTLSIVDAITLQRQSEETKQTFFTRSLKRRGQARRERSVRSPVVSVAWTTSALRTSRCCCFWLVLARELGQTRDRGVPGQSASVELISVIAIQRLHLQRQVVRLVTQISFGRRAQTDTTDHGCADVMKRETPQLRHGTVRRRVGRCDKSCCSLASSQQCSSSSHTPIPSPWCASGRCTTRQVGFLAAIGHILCCKAVLATLARKRTRLLAEAKGRKEHE